MKRDILMVQRFTSTHTIFCSQVNAYYDHNQIFKSSTIAVIKKIGHTECCQSLKLL